MQNIKKWGKGKMMKIKKHWWKKNRIKKEIGKVRRKKSKEEK